MVRIPTPIPESAIESLGNVLSGSVIDILWKLGVALVIVVVAVGLVLAAGIYGLFGGFIGAWLLSALIEDDVRDIVVDVWNRDFWVWRV